MKVDIRVKTHRDTAGNWIAQVLVADRVVHEESAPGSEGQAITNALDFFASSLRATRSKPQQPNERTSRVLCERCRLPIVDLDDSVVHTSVSLATGTAQQRWWHEKCAPAVSPETFVVGRVEGS